MASNITDQAQLLMLLNQACMNGNPYQATSLGSNLAGLLASMAGGIAKQKQQPQERIRCIWVKGIAEDNQDADKLINVFGLFGNIQKIKFFDKKPDVALIEMSDAKGAEKAVAIMNSKKINGSVLQVSLCKSNDVKIQSSDSKSKDSAAIKQSWRYPTDKSKGRAARLRHMKDLSNKIVVGNLPEGKFDQLKKHIIDSGLTVKLIEGIKRQKVEDQKVEDKPKTEFTRAFVELATVDEAIGAIANLHNTWPNKFGKKRSDKEGRSYGLNFAFALYDNQ